MKNLDIKRDSKGRFAPGNGKYTKVIVSVFALIGVAMLIVEAIGWGATHQLQRPWYFETKEDSLVNRIRSRPFYTDVEPEIIIPVIRNVDFENLDTVEQKILDAFGEKNYSVMRAIAKCESNMNPEAVNWTTRDIGLYQINWPTWERAVKEKFGYTLVDMFDVDKNIAVAHWVWDRDGDGEGDVSPWVATTTQCFRDEL